MKFLIIVKNNIKKNKSLSLTLVAFIIFASILLYTGTSVVLDMNTFLDDKNEQYNGSDFTVITPKTYENIVLESLLELDRHKQLESIDVIYKTSTDFRNISRNEKSHSIGCLFLNIDNPEEISQLEIIDKGETMISNSIVLPYFLKIAKGYKTGDKISITYSGETKEYIIYGFSEDIMFATPSNISIYKCYVTKDEFNTIYEKENEISKAVLVKTKLEDNIDSAEYSGDYVKKQNSKINTSTDGIFSLDYGTMKIGVSVFLIIIMSILIVFSFIIIIIALTVMRFSIVTHIENNIKNIGSLEALGYTAKQLVFATVLQFVLITVFSTGIGFVLAVASSGIVRNLVSSSIGLGWKSGINIIALLISFITILTLVTSIAYITANKIRKITPIMALRSGINTHNFKKNHLPLCKSFMNVNITLGLKTLMQNMKQNITILIIIALMSFVCVFAFTANYNFNIDNTAVIRMIGIEKSHLAVSFIGEDSESVFDQIAQEEHVKKVVRFSSNEMTLSFKENEQNIMVNICDDYSRLEISTIVNGRYPVHDNEITVTGLVLKLLGAKLGDFIQVKGNETVHEFLIVGVTQQISQLGKNAALTEAGVKRLLPDYRTPGINVYLDSSDHINLVKQKIETEYKDLDIQVINIEEAFNTILTSFNSAVIALTAGCIIITIFIITLILYLLIKIKLIKERMHIGVFKALGYTTSQLVYQVIISFCPVCILGALIGTIMALFFINPAFATLLSVSGILNSDLFMDPVVIISTFLSISLYSVVITTLIAMRVRKITPYELFI